MQDVQLQKNRFIVVRIDISLLSINARAFNI